MIKALVFNSKILGFIDSDDPDYNDLVSLGFKLVETETCAACQGCGRVIVEEGQK